MRLYKVFASAALVAGMALTGSTALMAQDGRDIRHDYARADALRYDIARDRARLNQDVREGRPCAASYRAHDLARDRRERNAQYRDIRQDRRHD